MYLLNCHVIDMHYLDYVVDFYTEINYVENTINKLHIKSDLHSGYIHNLYHDKQESINDLFCKYIIPLLKDIENPALVQE